MIARTCLPLWLLLVFAWLAPVYSQSRWNVASGGNWTDASNWVGGVPNSVGAQANFPANLPFSQATISVNSPITLGTLSIQATPLINLNGTSPLTFDRGGNVAPEMVSELGAGKLTVNVPLQWNAIQPLVTRIAPTSSLEIHSPLGLDAGSMILSGGGALVLSGNNSSWNGDLDIETGTARVTSASGLSSAGGETRVHSGGTLSLAGNFRLTSQSLKLAGGMLRGNTRTQPAVINALELLSDSEIGGGLSVDGEIQGEYGLTFSENGTRLLRNNSYTGITRVRGDLAAEAPLALGSTASGTIIESGGILSLLALTTEPIEINQGTLRIFDGAFGYHQPIISHGGEVRLNGNPEFASPLLLQGGTTIISGGERFVGDVSGVGNLVLRNTQYDGAPLAHQGDTDWFTDRDLILNQPHSYTGATRLRGNNTDQTVTLSNALALGTGTQPLEVTNIRLNLEVPLQRDLVITGGGLEMQTGAASSTGKITLRLSHSTPTSEIRANTDVLQSITIESGEALLRSGNFMGSIDGPGDVVVVGSMVQLSGANAYHGTTTVYSGVVHVNQPTGLGGTDNGTVVMGGQLILNSSTAEPITVASAGQVIVTQPLPRLPLIGEEYSRWNGSPPAARVQVNIDGTFDGRTIVGDGILEVNSQATVADLQLTRGGSGIEISPGHSLTVPGNLFVHAGLLNVAGQFFAPTGLYKTTSGRLNLQALGNYEQAIRVEQGTAYVLGDTALGSAAGSTIVANHGASLVIADGVNLADRIELQNAQGTDEYFGGLSFGNFRQTNQPSALSGPLDLGSQGSKLSGDGSASLELRGPISGGSLVRTSYGNQIDTLSITHKDNTFTGDLDLRGGITVVKNDGRLTTLSRIRVGGGALMQLLNQPEDTVTDRIGDAVPLEMRGGRFRIDTLPAATSREQLGELQIAAGSSFVTAFSDPGLQQSLKFSELSRALGATVNFEVGTDQSIQFDQVPDLRNGLIGAWAVAEFQDDNRLRRMAFATYGPQGVDIIRQQSPMGQAGPTSNVDWTDDLDLVASRSIYSLQLDNVYRTLGSSARLTIESGGLLGRGQLTGGQITVGDDAGQELVIIGDLNIASSIVDNAHGPVNVTLVGGGRLTVPNQYTGTTRIVGDPRFLSRSTLAAGAIPIGTDLEIDNSSVQANTLDLTHFIKAGRGEFRATSLKAESIEISAGEMYTSVIGNGTFRKTGEGMALVVSDFHQFTGQIQVDEGVLELEVSQGPTVPTMVNAGGVLRLRGTNETFRAPLTLAGGELQATEVRIAGPVHLTAPSTIRAMGNAAGLSGTLTGSAPLKITGSSDGWLPINTQNSDLTGPVTLDSVKATTRPFGLGSGVTNVGAGATLELVMVSASLAEALPWTTPVNLTNGSLIKYDGLDETPVTGPISVAGASLIGNAARNQTLLITGPIDLQADAQLSFNGVGNLHLAGPIHLHGKATIDARARHVGANGIAPSRLQFSGELIAESDDARLDLVSVGVQIDASWVIPAGRSLEVLWNGQHEPLALSAPSQTLSGNGTLSNDVTVSSGAELRPGASVGHLTIDGAVTLSDAGRLQWEISDALPAVGHRGWDEIQVDRLSITSTVTSPFVIQVTSLSSAGQPGAAENFLAQRSGAWPIIRTNQLTGYAPERFTIDTSHLTNSQDADAVWLTTARADGLYLTYLVPGEIDQITDNERRNEFVHDLAGTWYGDTNWDGQFDSMDLIRVFVAGEYEDSIAHNSNWASGDWNGDRDVSTDDLVFAFQDGGYEQGRRYAQPVPEPSGALMISAATAILLLASRQQRNQWIA